MIGFPGTVDLCEIILVWWIFVRSFWFTGRIKSDNYRLRVLLTDNYEDGKKSRFKNHPPDKSNSKFQISSLAPVIQYMITT